MPIKKRNAKVIAYIYHCDKCKESVVKTSDQPANGVTVVHHCPKCGAIYKLNREYPYTSYRVQTKPLLVRIWLKIFKPKK